MRLTFNRSSHVYLNAGIIGLYSYLERARISRLNPPETNGGVNPDWFRELPEWSHGLEEDHLWVDTEQPIPLLEEVYYQMGKEHYDSSTLDALAKEENAWYDPTTDSFHKFPKKKTYGFGALLTNDAAGKTRSEDATVRQSSIKPEDAEGQHMLRRYVEYFEGRQLKLGAQLYRGEPYIKITRLKLAENDLLPGKKCCPLTSEGFRKLQSATNSSPTAGGILAFMSGLGTKAAKIGWKAMYLVRFAPVLCLYRYTNGLDTLFCYFYDKSTLPALYTTFKQLGPIYYPDQVKTSVNHLANFRIEAIWKKNQEAATGGRDFLWPYEILFQLIYTIDNQMVRGRTDTETGQLKRERAGPLQFHLLRADKYSGTMRPSSFSVFNHYDYTVRLIRLAIKKHGVDWPSVLKSLILSKPNYGKNDFELSRRLRDGVLRKIMTGQSFAVEYATLLYDCYNLRIAGENIGYKSFANLEKLFRFTEFESLNPSAMLSPETRERAYKLGVQIGVNIMNYGESRDTARDRAKAGRKYIIHLNKVRTYDDFLEAIVRVLTKYDGLTPSTELFRNEITEENFETIKLLTVIGALSRINSRLSREDAENTKSTNA